MLNWAQQFNIFCFLDTRHYSGSLSTYECLLAVGVDAALQGNMQSFKACDAFVHKNDWTFGHLSYELLHPLYKIKGVKKDPVGFPQFFLFKPQVVLFIQGKELHIEASNPQAVYDELMAWAFEKVAPLPEIHIQQQLTREQYIDTIRQLQQHILRGDCYEVNFCTEFFAENVSINPLQVFQNLMALSPNPFSALYKLEDKYLICASPERFLKKEKAKLIAQPIKGTAGRSLDAAEDLLLQNNLQNSAKEQAENVMIVDLLRNDLSKICGQGSVTVEELFGLYTFPQVHQLISTISGTLQSKTTFTQIIEALFPAGSMTGAPKQRVVELIDRYEPAARGIFSGAVGYISPSGDFDFNVVIRSIMYNETARYLSYQVGSGITFYSNPKGEWEECLLKASAIKKVLAP